MVEPFRNESNEGTTGWTALPVTWLSVVWRQSQGWNDGESPAHDLKYISSECAMLPHNPATTVFQILSPDGIVCRSFSGVTFQNNRAVAATRRDHGRNSTEGVRLASSATAPCAWRSLTTMTGTAMRPLTRSSQSCRTSRRIAALPPMSDQMKGITRSQ